MSEMIRSGGDTPAKHTGPYRPSAEEWVAGVRTVAEHASEPDPDAALLRAVFEGSRPR